MSGYVVILLLLPAALAYALTFLAASRSLQRRRDRAWRRWEMSVEEQVAAGGAEGAVSELVYEREISEAIDTWYSANYASGIRLKSADRASLARFIAQRTWSMAIMRAITADEDDE